MSSPDIDWSGQGPREKYLDEFLADLEWSANSRVKSGAPPPEKRPDPTMQLTKQLDKYEGHTFFYLGLLYGFCRLDMSVTEKFRAEFNNSAKTWIHPVEQPLMTVQGYPRFTDTKVCRVLQSIESPMFELFSGFVESQMIIDRMRKVVWKTNGIQLKIPDPTVDQQVASIVVFCPRQWDFSLLPVQPSPMFVKTPEVRRFDDYDPDLERNTKEAFDE